MLKAAIVLATVFLLCLVRSQQHCGNINIGGNTYNLATLASAYVDQPFDLSLIKIKIQPLIDGLNVNT